MFNNGSHITDAPKCMMFSGTLKNMVSVISISLTFNIFIPQVLYSQEYYRSNNMGMELEKIGVYEKEESEYFLTVEKNELKKTKNLFMNGEFLKKWEIFYNSEGKIEKVVETEKERMVETVYNGSRIQHENTYTDGKLTERTEYFFAGKRDGYRTETYDSDGKLVSKKGYTRSGDGKMSSVKTLDSNENEKGLSVYSFSENDIKDEWQKSDDGGGRFFSYINGNISYVENWKGDEMVSREVFFYSDDVLVKTVETFTAEGGKSFIRKYDDRKRIISETEKKGDSVIKTVYNTFENDNLVKKIITAESYTEKYLYSYDGDVLAGEEFYRNGDIRKRVFYTSENEYYEDLYSDNRKYMRIYYRDDEKYKIER